MMSVLAASVSPAPWHFSAAVLTAVASADETRKCVFKGRRKRGEENKEVEMLTFSEIRSRAKSSNNQQARSKQASASPNILINLRSHPSQYLFKGAATKLNGKVAGASNIFTLLGRSKGGK